jgi:hypothetical protein
MERAVRSILSCFRCFYVADCCLLLARWIYALNGQECYRRVTEKQSHSLPALLPREVEILLVSERAADLQAGSPVCTEILSC